MLIFDPFLVFNYLDSLHQQRFYLKYVTELLLAAFFQSLASPAVPPVLQSGSIPGRSYIVPIFSLYRQLRG